MKPSLEHRIPTKPTLGFVLALGFFVAGVSVGTKPLSDNSFFTHLATGHIIWDTHSVPTVDPYTFIAAGQPWVVQSWLASVIYAGLENTFGLVSIRFLHAGLAGLAGLGIWHLTRSVKSLVPRLAIAALTFAACSPGWVERPLMFGFLGLLALLLLHEGRMPVWLAIPIMWVWVNTHGSFPLGVIVVVALWIGQRLDKSDFARSQRLLIFTVLGTLLGGLLSPLYGRILIFPIQLLERNGQFQNITEWASPSFNYLWARVFLFQLLLVVVALPALKTRRWERVLPLSIAIAAGLLGVRNLSMAALIMTLPLVEIAPLWGSLKASKPTILGIPLLAPIIVGAFGTSYYTVKSDDLDLKKYPIEIIEYLEAERLLPNPDIRIAYRERVGNYLNYRYGPLGITFFDDRFDMFSHHVVEGQLDLYAGIDALTTFDTYGIDYVMWQRESAVSALLRESQRWQEIRLPNNVVAVMHLNTNDSEEDAEGLYALFKRI